MSDEPLYMHEDFWPQPDESGFIHPNWRDIGDVIHETRDEAERPAAWAEARDRWVRHTHAVFNEYAAKTGTNNRKDYHIIHGQHSVIVGPYKEDVVADIASLTDKFRDQTRLVLGAEITADPPMGYVIFIPHDRFTAQHYLNYFGVDACSVAGVCFKPPGPHIVIHDMTRFELRLTLIHELNHAVLHRLSIPTWVHEGLSRYFETRILNVANMRYASEMDLSRNRFWREQGLEDFWNGSVFHDGRSVHGYVLAQKVIVRLLKGDAESFKRFMLAAEAKDAGDAACRSVYGMGVLDLIRNLVGPGDWKGPVSSARSNGGT
jgi:hypothetical protein